LLKYSVTLHYLKKINNGLLGSNVELISITNLILAKKRKLDFDRKTTVDETNKIASSTNAN